MEGSERENDTPPQIAAMVRSGLMRLRGPTRLKMGVQMFEAARAMIASFPQNLSTHEKGRLLFERGEPLPVVRGP
jgi:hypothetical protein